MQETEATIITSLVSKSEAVAECLSLSISSFIDESFQYTYLKKQYMPLVDNNHNKIQSILRCSLGRTP